MKKINKKGFLLAESIIVGVFVLSLFTFLFINVVPLVGQYEAKEKYDTITGAYNANLVRTMILEDNKVDSILELNELPYKYYEREDLCSSDNLEKVNYCNKLLGDAYLNVDKVYVTWYRTEKIKQASRNNDIDFDRATRDYIDSLDGFKQPSGSTYSKYKRLIIYYNDGTFANIEVKVAEGDDDDGSSPVPGGGGSSGEELGCIITAQPASGTKKGINNWFIGDVNLYLSTSGKVIEYGLATTDTPDIPIYNNTIVATHTEDTSGIYYYGYVKDLDGFEERCSVFIKKDTTSPKVADNPTAPSPEIYNPTNGNPTSVPFSLTVNASDKESGIDYWYYSYDEENWTKYDDPEYDSYELEEYITSPFTKERNEDVYIKVCNKAGLCGINSTRINIDLSPPECTITHNGTSKNGFYTGNVTFTLTPDEGTIKYLISSTQQDRTKLSAASFDNKLTKVMSTDSNGTSYYGYIMDPAGNIGECVSTTVKRDTTPPPQPTIENPTGGTWTKNEFSLTVKSTDTNSGNNYWYYSYDSASDDSKVWNIYNEAGYNSYEKTEYITSPFSLDRNQLVYIRVCDKAGNCSKSASTHIALDTTPPTCELVPNRTIASTGWFNASSGSPLNLTISTNDEGTTSSGVDTYNVSTNSSPSYGMVASASSIAQTSGKTYYCYVKDKAGNTGSNTYEVKRDVDAPSYSTYSLANTARGNLRPYFNAYSASDRWISGVSCSGSSCSISACASSAVSNYHLDGGIVYDFVSFSDSLSGYKSVWLNSSEDLTCSSFPCRYTQYYYANDYAGNSTSLSVTWSIDYVGGSSGCQSGGSGTGG